MKTRSIQTLLLAATLGLLVTACNNDSDQTVDITKPINVKLSLTTTGTNIPTKRVPTMNPPSAPPSTPRTPNG